MLRIAGDSYMKKISVSWLFDEDKSNAPVKIRIGPVRGRYGGKIRSWKQFLITFGVGLAVAAVIGIISILQT